MNVDFFNKFKNFEATQGILTAWIQINAYPHSFSESDSNFESLKNF